MAQAGLPKLNLASKSISIKSSASSSLSGAQRSGISYGIMAQRSNNSIFSPKMAYSASTSALRHQLNSRVIINNNIPARAQKQDNGMSTMEKLMMISMMGNMAAQFGKGIADTIKSIKGSKTDTSNNNNNVEGKGGTGTLDATTLNQKLKNATTYKDIQSIEDKLKTELSSFSGDYKSLIEDAKNNINQTINDGNFQKALQDAKASIDLNSLPTGSTGINISENSTDTDFDNAEKQIDVDIDKVSQFKEGQLEPAVEKLSAKSGELKGTIDSNEIEIGKLQYALSKATPDQKAGIQKQIDELQQKNNELKQQMDNINAAKGKLEKEIPSQLDKLIGDLKNKKEKLDDLKETKGDITDKKYDLVKNNDEQITKNIRRMDTLAKVIDSLKNGKKAEAKEINEKIKEYNAYARQTANLVSSLEGAPTEVKNAKGKSYSVTNKSVKSDYTTEKELENVDLNDKASKNIQENSASTPRTTNPIGNAAKTFGTNTEKNAVSVSSEQKNRTLDGGIKNQDGTITYKEQGYTIIARRDKSTGSLKYYAENPASSLVSINRELSADTKDQLIILLNSAKTGNPFNA